MVALVKGWCLNCVNFVLQILQFTLLPNGKGWEACSNLICCCQPSGTGLLFPCLPKALVPGQQCSKPHCRDTPASELRHGPEHRLKTSGHELRLLSKAVTYQEAVSKSQGKSELENNLLREAEHSKVVSSHEQAKRQDHTRGWEELKTEEPGPRSSSSMKWP